MPKQFKPEDVAAHRQAYKVILADGRRFVNTTVLSEFTRTRYTLLLQEILDRLAAELGTLRDDAKPAGPPVPRSQSDL
ncbi:unnamed protein product [marine sediment metagenome]|uniref:Uncharacterized protein n=1 Tax=marine sediment metagenome TaxID=412755 RepID=X1GEI2_9ZZZZ